MNGTRFTTITMKNTYEEPLTNQVAENAERESAIATQAVPAERGRAPLLTALFASTAALAACGGGSENTPPASPPIAAPPGSAPA
ncbi:hypothetical protein DBR12_01105, partial [Acidovorax sp. HMWF029]